MCRLSLIFNEILVHMYDPILQNTEIEMVECLQTQEPALQRWWDELPTFLKLEPARLPPRAPPSHIITMKSVELGPFNPFKTNKSAAAYFIRLKSSYTGLCLLDSRNLGRTVSIQRMPI